MRRISEVNTIPDIRERNDRPKDKQPKHQVTSTVQRQMVQKFVKELSDSAKQPDRSDSAERTATEQVETTVREIVYEAVQLPRRAIQHPARKESADSSAGVQPEQSDQPHHAPESPRERTDAPRTRSDATPPQSTSIPAAQEQARRAYVQQTAKNGHASAADHVGAAAAYHSDRAIGRKCTASAHGGCTHPTRPEATTERIGTHTAGAGPSRLCPASRKGGCPSAIDHARAAARASCCAIRAVDREYATPTHGGCANTLCAKTTPKCANRTGTRPSRLCKASKEIPRRKNRLRGIIFIRSRWKFGLRTICRRAQRRRFAKGQRLQSCAVNRVPNRHQKMRRTFSISSRLVHGRRAALNLIAAA